MKHRLDKLEDAISKVTENIYRIDGEIITLRDFKHTTNGTLHSHNGKLDVIANQQSTTTAAIEKLTKVVEDAVKKLSTLMTLKSMATGAAIVIPPILTACYFLFEWYIKSMGME